MTIEIEEAIRELTDLMWKYAEELNEAEQNYEINKSISLNKIFNSIKLAIEALKKQVPKRPDDIRNFANMRIGLCPVDFCDDGVNDDMNYCVNCGQRLEWGKE